MKKILLFSLLLSPIVGFGQGHYCEEEQELVNKGLVDIRVIDPTILVELKYSTTDNFTKKDVYGDIDDCFLQPLAAQKLKKASELLRKNYPNLRLLIYDGVRSRKVQWKLWNALPDVPPKLRKDYVANPEEGSIHNFGCAVDLTVANADGTPLDMGTKFDFFGELAYPRLEQQMLNEGKLTQAQLDNRLILRKVMTKAGFEGITSEWWHFNALSRKNAGRKYGIIE